MKNLTNVKVLFFLFFLLSGHLLNSQTSRPIILDTNWILPGPPYGEIPLSDVTCLEIESPDFTLMFAVNAATTSLDISNIEPIHIEYSFDGVTGQFGPLLPSNYTSNYHYEGEDIYVWSFVYSTTVQSNCQGVPVAPFQISYSLVTPDLVGTGYMPYPIQNHPTVFNPEIFGTSVPSYFMEKNLCCPHVSFLDANEGVSSSLNNEKSETEKVEIEAATNDIQISPNPFKESFFINYHFENLQETTLTLIDLNGKVIQSSKMELEGKGKFHFEFKNENVPDGLYLLQVNSKDNNQIFKLIKNN